MKIDSLSIRNFRGIKDLTIPFDKKSWVIHGRNGSGKSGVIDAIEFGLSGTIGRLTGEGRGTVSVKEHGPHVDSKEKPQEAEIVLSLDLNGQGDHKVTRNCNTPSKFKITPENQASKLFNVGNEIVLSRREILKFILTEPGKRSKEVQSLLKIEKLDEIRSALQTLKNKVGRNLSAETQEFDRAKTKLKEWLKIEELSKEKVLEVVNKHRAVLQLNSLLDLSDETKLNEGVKEGNTKQFLNKAELSNLVGGIKNSLYDVDGSFSDLAKQYLDLVETLEKKEDELKKLNRLGFYETGLKLISQPECPFCENEWEQDDLRNLIEQKIKELSGIKNTKNKIDQHIQKLKIKWRGLKTDAESYEQKIAKNPNLSFSELEKVKSDLAVLISEQSSDSDTFKNAIRGMTLFGLKFEKSQFDSKFLDLEEQIKKLPEKSNEEVSREFLVICQERLDNYRASKRKYEYQKKKDQLTSTILEKYNGITEVHLNNLYTEIEKDFSRFYQIVNYDDEADFTGNLVADGGALDFKVDFYDRGKFPPAAYHSEGHQDGMGLCLYLALMKKILGDNFTLAILDDVLMSIDESHKKSFCKLLKKEFPNTQFIITTHDKYWQKQMITEELVTHATTLHFKNWSVDTGPCVWNEKDSWEEVDGLIQDDKIPSASHSLRRFLEYIVDDISVRIAAKIPRNPSGDYDMGELLTGATSRYGDLLKKAIKSARSWGNQNLVDTLESEKNHLAECLKKANSEAWGMNAMVHFNSWADMDQNAFREIRNAYYNLVQIFKCDSCNTLLHVVPIKGNSEILKCDCGQKNYNLKSKS